jgi:hypothetical protein
MPRKWKNSDDQTYFVDKAIENRLEKLRCDLIEGYSRKKINKKNNYNQGRNGGKKNYTPKNK